MVIHLRKQAIKVKGKPTGKTSLFLDINIDGKRTRKYLKLTIFDKPTPSQKQTNKENLALADRKFTEVKAQLQNNAFGFIQDNSSTDFIEYYREWKDSYDKKDKTVIVACFNHFMKFCEIKRKSFIPGRELTKTFCADFAEYLKTKLNYNSPKDYFKKFRRVLNRAYDERIIGFRPLDIKVKYNVETRIRKPILNETEIKLLLNQPFPEGYKTDIYRAYVLSLNTGMDYSTVKKMIYGWIDGDTVDFVRPKTGRRNRVPLNKYARAAIGEIGRKDELVFKLPGIAYCINNVRDWAKAAGIHKKITWHSARHSFATQMIHRIDLKNTSEALGHSDLRSTQVYLHADDERKRKAINSLPGVE